MAHFKCTNGSELKRRIKIINATKPTLNRISESTNPTIKTKRIQPNPMEYRIKMDKHTHTQKGGREIETSACIKTSDTKMANDLQNMSISRANDDRC